MTPRSQTIQPLQPPFAVAVFISGVLMRGQEKVGSPGRAPRQVKWRSVQRQGLTDEGDTGTFVEQQKLLRLTSQVPEFLRSAMCWR